MPTATAMTAFTEWLSPLLAERHVNHSQLAAYIGSRPQTVSAWFNEDRIPSPALCQAVARFLHESPEKVLRIAGHLPPEANEPAPQYPGWLTETLDQLTEPELRVVKASADAVLELREAQARYEAQPPATPDEDAPGPPPPSRRSR